MIKRLGQKERSSFLCILFSLTLASCVGEDFGIFSVSIKKTGDFPTFVFSTRPGENDLHLPHQYVSIYDMKEDGTIGKRLWIIESELGWNGRLKELTYGTAPSHWIERSKALPLVRGKFFSINEFIIFRKTNGSYHPLKIAFSKRSKKEVCDYYRIMQAEKLK